MSAVVDITEVYTITEDGLYTVQYTGPLYYFPSSRNNMFQSNDDLHQVMVEDQESTVYLKDTYLLKYPTEEDSLHQESEYVTIEGCSSAKLTGATRRQKKNLIKLHAKLCTGFQDAHDAVADNKLYKRWFGKYTTACSNTVKDIPMKCKEGITDNEVEYKLDNPKCKPGINAMVRAGTPRVSLWASFFKKRTQCYTRRAKVSQEGILAHEFTHVFGKTKDIKYGATANRKLARENPDNAVKMLIHMSFITGCHNEGK